MLFCRAHFRCRRAAAAGYSLLELMMVVMLVAVLGSIATASYGRYAASAKTASAISDIGRIKLTIDHFRLNNNDTVPAHLAAIGMDKLLDPWGRPYVYLNFSTVTGNGAKRKDRNLVPINSDFDLYSLGPDGKSAAPLSAKYSLDDVILANDGKFVGLARDY